MLLYIICKFENWPKILQTDIVAVLQPCYKNLWHSWIEVSNLHLIKGVSIACDNVRTQYVG